MFSGKMKFSIKGLTFYWWNVESSHLIGRCGGRTVDGGGLLSSSWGGCNGAGGGGGRGARVDRARTLPRQMTLSPTSSSGIMDFYVVSDSNDKFLFPLQEKLLPVPSTGKRRRERSLNKHYQTVTIDNF